MSHFSTIVVTAEQPSQEVLEKTLMPWHEFECTGYDNEYVVNIDDTAEHLAEFRKATRRRYRDPSGELHDPYDDRFYRDPLPTENPGYGIGSDGRISWLNKDWGDGRGTRAKVHFLPDGWTEMSVPFETFRGYLAYETGRPEVVPGGHDTYGFTEVSVTGDVVRTIKRTNPNRKWDWWTVGGRYADRLVCHPDRVCDTCLRGDLDLDTMTRRAVDKRRNLVREAATELGMAMGEMGEIWRACAAHIAEERAAFRASGQVNFAAWIDNLDRDHPVYVAWRKTRVGRQIKDIGVEETEPDLAVWADTAPALSAYAYVANGKWHQRGEMGWFGIAANETEAGQWQNEVTRMVASLPQDHWLTVVDCHI